MNAAEGTMYVEAYEDGTTDITFSFHYLLPKSVYSLWVCWHN